MLLFFIVSRGDFLSWVYENYKKIGEQKPLVHHITNWVTIYDCANITRSFKALPVMAHAPEEVEQMTGIASSLVLNIGTLTTPLIDAMIIAGKKANEKGIPVVLDAVGAGATDMRTEKCKEILENVNIDIIKGNSAEIGVLAGVEAEVRGVEAISVKGNPEELVKRLAEQTNSTVVITGKVDYVSNGKETFAVENGNEMMGSIVGTGCMSASVIGSFSAVEKDYVKAAAAALSCFGIAGEIAAEKSFGPGTFKINFYDAVYNLSQEQIESKSRIKQL